VEEFKVLRKIGSDHLPLFCSFRIDAQKNWNEDKVEVLEEGEIEKANEIIKNGVKEDGDRDEVASE
jgi:hypothetical protein